MSHLLDKRLCYRSILGVDVEGSTRLMDPDRGYLRSVMYTLLDQALEAGGISSAYRDPYLDRGDGAFSLIHPVDEAPKTALLGTVVPAIAALLAEHNTRHPQRAFRMRVVASAGEVTYDQNGCYGESLDLAFRLLGDQVVKEMLLATSASTVLVVSEDIHRCVVRHGYDGIVRDSFTQFSTPPISGLVRVGWARIVEPPQTMRRPDGSQN